MVEYLAIILPIILMYITISMWVAFVTGDVIKYSFIWFLEKLWNRM